MKKLLVIGMCILGLLVVTSSASAVSIPVGYDATIKFTDWSPTVEVSSELWGITYVTEIYETGNSTNVLWEDTPGTEEMTAMFYNLHCAVDYTNGLLNSGYIYFDNMSGTQATLDVYVDGQPDALLTSYDASGGPGARTSQKVYPTVTDGSSYMSLDYLDVIPDPLAANYDPNDPTTWTKYEYRIWWDAITQSGQAIGWLDVIPGSGYGDLLWGAYEPGAQWTPIGTLADFRLGCNILADTTHGWSARSEDPMEGHTVPEPATMLLLGSGLLGLAGFGRKKFFKNR